jgi:hypothetical protein
MPTEVISKPNGKSAGETVVSRVVVEYLLATDPKEQLKAYYALRAICVRACKDLFIPRPHDGIISTSEPTDKRGSVRVRATIPQGEADYARHLVAKRALIEAVEIPMLECLAPYHEKLREEILKAAKAGKFDHIARRVRSRIISLIRHRNAKKYQGKEVSLNQPIRVVRDGVEVQMPLYEALGIY